MYHIHMFKYVNKGEVSSKPVPPVHIINLYTFTMSPTA